MPKATFVHSTNKSSPGHRGGGICNPPQVRPHRRKAPKVETAPAPRMTELIGLTADGRMVLWATGMVQPVSRFKAASDSRYIEDGHYVINWRGHAITVHCGNFSSGAVSVLFMCSTMDPLAMSRAEVEAMLLGKVIPDPVAQAELRENMSRLLALLCAQNDTPERQRGRIR